MTSRAIDAAWPEWWSGEAEFSPSAVAELRYTLARRLGLAPQSLFDGSPVFLWRDQAKFKNLSVNESKQDTLTSFGIALGRILVASTAAADQPLDGDPVRLRNQILSSHGPVDLHGLLALAWSHGIPVVQALIWPSDQIGMHAMTVRIGTRFAILIGRRYSFPSQLAYVIAHELGHCLLGHLSGTAALVEMADPSSGAPSTADNEEVAANHFALALLTGDELPNVASSNPDYTATQLAQAASSRAKVEQITPGVLALCLGHETGRWAQTMGALKILEQQSNLASLLNTYAMQQLDRDQLSHDSASYLNKILGTSSWPLPTP